MNFCGSSSGRYWLSFGRLSIISRYSSSERRSPGLGPYLREDHPVSPHTSHNIQCFPVFRAHAQQVTDLVRRLLKYQICTTGTTSLIWPMRSRRTFFSVTSTRNDRTRYPCNGYACICHRHTHNLYRAKYSFAKQTITFWFVGSVVNGFRL